MKRLYRSRSNRVLFGVCGGLGEYFNIDPVIFRLLFIFFGFVFLYFIAALIIPEEY